MNFITKYYPYILLAIAILSLVLQWQATEHSKNGCGCNDQEDAGSGPIV